MRSYHRGKACLALCCWITGTGYIYPKADLHAIQMLRELDMRLEIPAVAHNLGHVALRQGDIARAVAYFRECLQSQAEMGNDSGIVEGLAGFAGAAAAEGDGERAARLFGVTDALHAATGALMWPAESLEYEHNLEIARSLLDAATWTAAWKQGNRMSAAEAVTYALERT